MCTLTFASFSGRLRVVFNRDEQRSRPPALPPRIIPTGPHAALMPIDGGGGAGGGGGTWIGVNAAGLVACLLNSSAPVPPHRAAHPALRSRGEIVPRLLHAGKCLEAAELAQAIDPAEFLPFKVIVLERYRWWMAQSDGIALYNHDIRAHLEPLMFASSGLGDELVDPPRRRAFEELLERGQFTDDVQDAFHASRWEDRPALSVMMSRPDARTVSRTTIELAASATLDYADFAEEPPALSRHTLALVRSGHSLSG